MGTLKLEALDLVASYGPNSAGENTRTLIDIDGSPHDYHSLWMLGKDAVITLNEILPGNIDRTLQNISIALPIILNTHLHYLDNSIFPIFCNLHDSGLITNDVHKDWRGESFPGKVEALVSFLEATWPLYPDDTPWREQRRHFAASAVLILLDDALMDSRLHSNNIDADIIGAALLWRHLNSLPNTLAVKHQVMLDMGKRELGRAGADKKNQENRELKADVFLWLDKHGDPEGVMAQAAKIIHEKKLVPVEYSSLYSWARQWKKEKLRCPSES